LETSGALPPQDGGWTLGASEAEPLDEANLAGLALLAPSRKDKQSPQI